MATYRSGADIRPHLAGSHFRALGKKTGQICRREKSSVSDLELGSLAGFLMFPVKVRRRDGRVATTYVRRRIATDLVGQRQERLLLSHAVLNIRIVTFGQSHLLSL